MEQDEFIQLFKAHRKELSNFLYYSCGDRTLAEDLVQEAFAILWEKRFAIKMGNVKSYLYTTSNHLFIDQYRHRHVKLELFRNGTIESTVESPEYIMEHQEFDQKLQNAIASLSEKERSVFLMNRIEGFTYAEIAERLSISVKAIEKRMHNAVEHLYKKLNHRV